MTPVEPLDDELEVVDELDVVDVPELEDDPELDAVGADAGCWSVVVVPEVVLP